MSAHPLDLYRPRDLGELLSTTLALYARHFRLFASLAFGTVLFAELIVFGIGAGWLWSGYDGDWPLAIDVIDQVLPIVVLSPLITATHVQAVAALGSGRVPAVTEALQAGLAVFARAVVVVLLYTIGSAVGLLLLIVPGVYAFVAWLVAVQAAVIEDLRGTAALRRSWQLVRGQWWRVFGISLVIGILPLLVGVPGFVALRALADATDSMAVYLAGRILGDAVIYSFTALAFTLLYFDLRARRTVTATTHAPAAEG